MDQDWQTIVIYGNRGKNGTNNGTNHGTNHGTGTGKKRGSDDAETKVVKRISRDTATVIRNARIARGFRTQKDLAVATGISAKVINQYEAGGAIIDHAILQRLRKTLNVKIST